MFTRVCKHLNTVLFPIILIKAYFVLTCKTDANACNDLIPAFHRIQLKKIYNFRSCKPKCALAEVACCIRHV